MSRRAKYGIGVGATLVLGAPLLAGLLLTPSSTAGPCRVVNGPTGLREIPESSGLAVSRRHPGVIWSHNDSGNDAVLFALDQSGMVRGRVAVPVRMRDWEDISAARCPGGDCLYLADIGDNGRNRPRVQVYRVPEPEPGAADSARPMAFDVAYEDGPHNAEALFVIGEDLFVVTRDRTGSIYRGTIPSDRRELTLARIGGLGLEAVSDAEASPDGNIVAVRTSYEAVFYRTAALLAGDTSPYLRIPIDRLREAQGEGIALDGSLLHLSSEGGHWRGGGSFVSLRCTFPR
jgi:hypothetical protein